MQKGGVPENFGGLKRVGPEKKKNTNFTPEKWVYYMIFCGVDAYFSWQKWGPWKIVRSKRGALKIFRANFFLHLAPLTSVCERSLIIPYTAYFVDKAYNAEICDHSLFSLQFCFIEKLTYISRVDKQRNEPGRWKSHIVAIFLLFLTLLHVLT